MNAILGMMLIGATVVLYCKYRPRWEESITLCIVSLLTGALTPLMPAHTWFLLTLAIGTKVLAFVCCWLQLSREDRHRKADKARDKRAIERLRSLRKAA